MGIALTPRPGAGRGVIRLDQWIATNGPLSFHEAFLVAIDACAQASRLTEAELGAVCPSLNASAVMRGGGGGWTLTPAAEDSGGRPVNEREVVERIGALLFHCLTGQPLTYLSTGEQALRTTLRTLRPELPTRVADLTVRALLAHRRSGPTLAVFARDLRQMLGLEREPDARRPARAMLLIGVAVFALAAAVLWVVAPFQQRVQAHGLTNLETTELDVRTETAQTFALMDEHTAALGEYSLAGRLWHGRLAPDDPRPAWNEAHEAWIRSLSGDRFTTEQLLANKPPWLAAQLGDRHPYTRAVRLGLAAMLDARGATAEASALRDQAERATSELFQQPNATSDLLDTVPAPPGVLAHLAPNAPPREGFRLAPDGSFFVPLTSVQRMIAGRDGWRLHLIARDTCRASIVVGNGVHPFAVSVSRATDNSWQARVDGTKPSMLLRGPAADGVTISIVSDGEMGPVRARVVDHGFQSSPVDRSIGTADPPYTFTFQERSAGGCALVWLEMPFPPVVKVITAAMP